MGCNSSQSVAVEKPKKTIPNEVSGALTEKEILSIQKTWRVLADDMTGRGMKIFMEIFRRNPDTKALFPFRNQKMEELHNDVKFRGHASRFMQAIGAAVDNIHALDQNLAPLLVDLGKAHSTSGMFDPAYFELFKDVIFSTFEKDLGHKLMPEVEEAWTKLLVYIMTKLKEGYGLGKQEG